MGRTKFRVSASVVLLGAMLLASASAQSGKDAKPGKDVKPVPLPSGPVVVADSVEAALKSARAIFTAEKYQELMDELTRLRRAVGAPKFDSPSKCALKGKAEGTFLTLQAVFEFETLAPGDTVRLACGLALATGVNLDGRTPALIALKDGADAGFAVQIDKAGSHTLTLDLMVPLAARPGGLGFILDLPRAAITTIEIDLPPGSKEPRLSGKALDATVTFKGNRVSGPIGPMDRLDLAWRGPGSAASTAVTEAEGTVTVRVESRETTTEAKLDLRVRGGQVSEWTLLVPKDAEVTVADPGKERVKEILNADRKQLSLRTIKLKGDSSESLAVTVRTTAPTPKPGAGKLVLGPFNVAGVVRQFGTVLVSGASADLHLELSPLGDLARRGLTDDEQRRDATLVAAFGYGPVASTGPAWLELETEPVNGQIKARPSHVVRLADDGEGGLAWRVETTLLVTPRWADVDRLLVALPPGCKWDADASQPLPPRVRSVSYDAMTRNVEFRLSRTGDGSAGTFTVRLAARFDVLVDPTKPGEASLPLPRPAGILDGEGTLVVNGPAGIEVHPAGDSAGLELARQAPHELAYRFSRQPPQVGISWRPYHPPVELVGVVQLTLGPGEGRIRHELDYRFPASEAPRRLRLAVPPVVAPGLTPRQGEARLEGNYLVLEPAGKGAKLVLEYAFPLPQGGTVDVPLVVPEGASRADCKVLVWGESGRLPSLVGNGWAEVPLEAVPSHDRLPVLAARTSRLGAPLKLRLGDALSSPLLCSRALVRAVIDADGAQSYRATYRVERLTGAPVDLELPGHAAALGVQASLDGVVLDYDLPEFGPALKGRIVRLRLSAGLAAGPSLLEVRYRVAPASANPFVARLSAPRLLGGEVGFPTRWMVSVPADWVVLGPDPGASAPRVWARAGWLFAPRCAYSEADLERWLTGNETAEGAGRHPTLALWRDGSHEVPLLHVPRQGWLLCCSLLLAAVGLGLTRLASSQSPGRAAWAWAFTLLLLAVAVALSAAWPLLAAQVAYGSQPGLAVLLVLGMLMWGLAERRRRQIVYLPSFTRSRAGSSLNRAVESQEAGQPSTVDAPRKVSSSMERQGS